MKALFKEFKEFISKGNAMMMAVGIIIASPEDETRHGRTLPQAGDSSHG